MNFNKKKFPLIDIYDEVIRGRPIKPLTLSLKSSAGKSSLTGRITVRHRGGGHSKRYRLIDFTRPYSHLPALVLRFEKDPNRSAFIALTLSRNGYLSYIIAAHRLWPGCLVRTVKEFPATIQASSVYPLYALPVGLMLHNLQFTRGDKFKAVRAAGVHALLLKQHWAGTIVRMPSTEVRLFPYNSVGSAGMLSNPCWDIGRTLVKAGQSRWLGKRPSVRGVAMNPIDHPHGGGQGKTAGGRASSTTPWGRLTKGKKTRVKPVSKSVVTLRVKRKSF
jgi:large subunit ribosomal protein L2